MEVIKYTPASGESSLMPDLMHDDAGGENGLDPQLAALLEQARGYCTRGKAQATRDAYQTDWQDFSDWCTEHRLCTLPAVPGTVALYLTALIDRGQKINTLSRRLAAISQAHQVNFCFKACNMGTIPSMCPCASVKVRPSSFPPCPTF